MLEPLEIEWDKSLEEGVLRIPRCENCNSWNWYPVPVCKYCQHEELSWQLVTPRGVLFSATKVHRNFTGLDIGEVPYIVGLIEIEGLGGVRLTCRYMGQPDNLPEIGEPVRLSFQKGSQGRYLGFE